MTTRKAIEVVAAIIEAEGKILCVQRGANARHYISKKWEFPGGKVETGEVQPSALEREIAEELQVAIAVGDRLTTIEYAYPDFDVTMHAYRCSLLHVGCALTLTEHIASRWLTPENPAFAALDWAAADLPIVQMLRETTDRNRGQG